MILDGQQGLGHEPPRYDLCIVGAGAAGITLALELEGTGLRVCLLEAGGPGYEAETQRLLEGEVVGQPYPMLRDTRVGALGGSTTVWAGWCRPLEALDFEPPGLVRRRRMALRPRRASSLVCPSPRDLRARRLRVRPRALGPRPRPARNAARRSRLRQRDLSRPDPGLRPALSGAARAIDGHRSAAARPGHAPASGGLGLHGGRDPHARRSRPGHPRGPVRARRRRHRESQAPAGLRGRPGRRAR